MRAEPAQLKQLAAELSLKNRVLKKSLLGKEMPWDNQFAARADWQSAKTL
jgi:hypothetical protein